MEIRECVTRGAGDEASNLAMRTKRSYTQAIVCCHLKLLWRALIHNSPMGKDLEGCWSKPFYTDL